MQAVRRVILVSALTLTVSLCAAAAATAPAAPAVPAASAAAIPVASSPRFANLPLQREEGGASSTGLPLAVQLVLAGALIAVLAVVYRMRQHRSLTGGVAGRTLRAVHALRLSQGASLHVVHWGEEELLLAASTGSVTVLARRPQPGADTAQGGRA